MVKHNALMFLLLTGLTGCGSSSHNAPSFLNRGETLESLKSKLDGIYRGSMMLSDESIREIPLGLSMVVTNQISTEPPPDSIFDDQKQIDTSFLIDESSTIIKFNKTRLQLETGKIDFLYMKTGSSAPDFRLEGVFKDRNTIAGIVHSGTRALQIGTFTVTKSEDQSPLVEKSKYLGVWRGPYHRTVENETVTMEFVLSAQRSVSYLNGTKYEIENTENIAGVATPNMQVPDANFPINEKRGKINIDYLRREMEAVAVKGENNFTINCNFDFQKQTMTGYAIGSLVGQHVGEFTLKRIK